MNAQFSIKDETLRLRPSLEILVGRNWPLNEIARLCPIENKKIFSRIGFDSYKELFDIMEDKMYLGIDGLTGIGISATQLGIPYQMMIVKGELSSKKVFRIINPVILGRSEQSHTMTEGCLSFPGINFQISRSEEIVVSFFDQEGYNSGPTSMNGMIAKVFQHEYDHLYGKFFFEKVSGLSRQVNRSLQRNLAKLDKRGEGYSNYMRKVFENQASGEDESVE